MKLNSKMGLYRKENFKNLPEILFTGFHREDRSILEAMAEKNGFYVCTKVTNYLEYLVCGYNAGPSKIQKARMNGATLLDESEFKIMILKLAKKRRKKR